MSELVDLTRQLVEIPSHEDETAAGDAIEEWLRAETDAAVERDADGNVIARRRGPEAAADAATSLALVGHHDVVPPAPEQVVGDAGDSDHVDDAGDSDHVDDADRYVVEERGGRLYGRGAADMKGAVAACMVAFRDADVPANQELVFASFVGEEVGGVGARGAIDRGFAPDYALVAEGSTNYSAEGVTDVVVAHKGRRGSTITATGDSAHASEVAAGTNAIYRASDTVDVVRDLEFPTVEVVGEALSGSVAVTEIDGGTAMNVIPDECTLTVDERTVPGERAALERVEEIEGVDWTVDQDLPPMACDDEAFANAALAAARSAQGAQAAQDAQAGGSDAAATPQQVTKPHATDAGWLAEAGTTCVVCGPSEPGEAHTETESVSIDVLARCRRIYRTLAERDLGADGGE